MKSNPISHRIDCCLVSVNSCENSFLPLSIFNAVIPCWTGVMSSSLFHTLWASWTMSSFTNWAVWKTIWVSLSTVVHESIRWHKKLYSPSCIELKHLNVEVSMLINVAFFNKNRSLILHVSRRRSRVLIIMTVLLDSKSFRLDHPVPTNRVFLGIGRVPDFDFSDILITQSFSLHFLFKRFSKVVIVRVAHQQSCLSSNNNLEIRDPIVRDLSSHSLLELCEDLGKIDRGNMLSSVNSPSGEPNTNQVWEISSNSFLYVLLLSVQISETYKPSIVQLEGIVPGRESSFAMEIKSWVWDRGKLIGWSLASFRAIGI